ncbi:unnamed protein product [Symbiodinium pilosum]|uniref:Uncharacterized protein n=1 Tax=Symbiodinium pilosum TaxID=2952 RepID=A0A812X4L0_SYMPI|nr:unnamed protein product [Symbiodinium pilosum]
MRYGSFAASMTGNVIFAGRELAKCSWPDVCFYVLIMVSWTTGSCLYIEIEKICPRKGGSWTAIAVALISTAVDVAYNIDSFDGKTSRWWILGLIPIFGVAEAFALKHLRLPTTGVAKHLFNISRLREVSCREAASADREDVMLSAVMLGGMICGAVLGERLVATFGLQVRWCFMPVAPLVALAVCVHEWLHSRAACRDGQDLEVGSDEEEDESDS